MLKLEAVEAMLKFLHLAHVRLHQWAHAGPACLAGRQQGVTPNGKVGDTNTNPTVILRLASRPSHSIVLLAQLS
jgi:hypothetical protein